MSDGLDCVTGAVPHWEFHAVHCDHRMVGARVIGVNPRIAKRVR